MWTYAGEGINDIYPRMIQDVLEHGTKETQRGLTTRELHPVIFELEHPELRLVTSYGRPVNVAFALAEVLWILCGRSDVEMLKAYNSRIDQFSDDGFRFNAPYGYRLRKAHGIDQLMDVVRTLQLDPGSRQAVMAIWHPAYDNGTRTTKDRACNLLSHFMIRDGRLDLMQVLRSNDAIWGTPYNVIQWTCVQEYVATLLGVPMGKYVHIADSFHLYDPPLDGSDVSELDVQPFNLYDALMDGHDRMQLGEFTLQDVERFEELIRRENEPQLKVGRVFWDNLLEILTIHRCYTQGVEDDLIYEMLRKCGDLIFSTAQMRFYMHNRWSKRTDLHLHKRVRDEFEPEVVAWLYGERV